MRTGARHTQALGSAKLTDLGELTDSACETADVKCQLPDQTGSIRNEHNELIDYEDVLEGFR